MARIYGAPKQTGLSVGSNVRIVGIPQLLAKLKLVGSVARLELGLLAAGAAQHMYELALVYVPVKTGNLKSGIKVAKLGSYNWQVTAASMEGSDPKGVGKNKKEYAAYVENGWSHSPGRFFMQRAWSETLPIAKSDLVLIARKIEAL